VVDRTNATIAERRRYIEPAREAGFRLISYFFLTAPSEALERNASRQASARVPVAGVLGTYARLQPPSHDEGFDELHIVRLQNKCFTVELAESPR
jgi:predicted kinase